MHKTRHFSFYRTQRAPVAKRLRDERVACDGFEGEAATENQVIKEKDPCKNVSRLYYRR
jgi:hypothetical protein